MKRLLLVLALTALPTTLLAQTTLDRDVLMTPDGTLYTVESTINDGSAAADVNIYLRLTAQRGTGQAQTIIVPDSVSPGVHSQPALAYDNDSNTLFLFWLHMPNAMSSELLLSSYRNGSFQPAVSLTNKAFHLEYNLRIKTSHRVGDEPLLVHAVWWEVTGDGESARYGLLGIEKGEVTSIYLDDLSNFLLVDQNDNPTMQGSTPFVVDANFNREILRHPTLIDTGNVDSMDVIFGDVRTNSFNRITLMPIVQGRIHIPIGHVPGPRVGAPRSFDDLWSASVDTIVNRDGSMLLYNPTTSAVNYIVYSGGAWSSVKSVALSDKLSADAAVAALARMMNQ
jgi:hypothetical protein